MEKEERDYTEEVGHSHKFNVNFGSTGNDYTIECHEPCTVLHAINSHLGKEFDEFKKNNEHADGGILIQLGKEDKKYTAATHFPCSCVSEGESLIVMLIPKKNEIVQHDQKILPKDGYVVFYIDTKGGKNTITKELFRSKVVTKFKFLCVYGEKGMTVEEALKKDGRFVNNLGDFSLSSNEDPSKITKCTERINSLHLKEFKICLPRVQPVKTEDVKHKSETKSIAELKGISVKHADPSQFPDLRKWMENRFPDNSYQTKLNVRKENFGKIQQSFREVHRVKKLLKMGDSVCKIVVKDVCTGTGFVLFDRFILTNAHLLQNCVEGKRLNESVEVFALFNYEETAPNEKYFYFSAEKTLVDIDEKLDYAILELKPDGQRCKQQANTKNIKVPPGLLEKIGPLPETGEACLIGHPGGDVKQKDATCIIEAEKREQVVNDHLQYMDTLFIVLSVNQILENQGIQDMVVTYDTFMYHGSSGSPVFDAHGQIFGLHTAGYTYGFPGHEKSVIEFAQPLLTIIEKFVSNLKTSGNKKLLERVEEVAKKNLYIKKIVHPEPAKPEEPRKSS